MHKNNAVFFDLDPIVAICQKLAENGKEWTLQSILLTPPQRHRGSVQWREAPVEPLGALWVTGAPKRKEY